MLNDPVVIVGAARTPMGAFQGDFEALAASDSAPRRSRPPSSARA